LEQKLKCTVPIPRSPSRTFKLQKKPSAPKKGHPTLQNMNFRVLKVEKSFKVHVLKCWVTSFEYCR